MNNHLDFLEWVDETCFRLLRNPLYWVVLVAAWVGFSFYLSSCSGPRTIAEKTAKHGVEHSHRVLRAEPAPSRVR